MIKAVIFDMYETLIITVWRAGIFPAQMAVDASIVRCYLMHYGSE